MSVWSKFAIVFLCAAICALSVTLLPRGESTQRPQDEATPVKLHERPRTAGLLV